ncbi:pyrimidodiazepine synthase-like isoform X2 [Limulus polyphemus]|nr:pyrimidodiazepine synthase-like isoform X2 [Limulus polyphemus]XP_022247491.1 pyrimidodiazepine synthase-like isoform X2 [Limulus polyphemus]XP_022247492.1 pyrimidodiazepine synthase-like isoform X2 [Limulus polyphemus]XP_022247493.1 pyrimidodiazepine synthase-like isoform X2 [Limulus polyphemus]XP_022247494.1 pyrimidodiazepine synthase-like isoform X2 [Limulus polyphemus]XP_022247495.1 pyrimidodiazepine synthase-like isoform X2 [Limulus polyphemus]XP_022247496.1 pyrimidodiazepine synthase
MRVYSMRYCPYAQRTLLMLTAKNIPYEVVNVNLQNKPEWLFEKNPLGKIPIIEKDGQVICDSLTIAIHLEEVYPDIPLYPSDPYQKAQEEKTIELFSKFCGVFIQLFKGECAVADIWQKIQDNLVLIEKKLASRGTHFFGGSKPGVVDYVIWPWFERLPAAFLLCNELTPISSTSLPTLTAWMDRMKEDPAVKANFLTGEQHANFIKDLRTGIRNYDREL